MNEQETRPFPAVVNKPVELVDPKKKTRVNFCITDQVVLWVAPMKVNPGKAPAGTRELIKKMGWKVIIQTPLKQIVVLFDQQKRAERFAYGLFFDPEQYKFVFDTENSMIYRV